METPNLLQIKKDFPLLKKNIHYLDNAATTQRPECVIKEISKYYENTNSNIDRGIYELSEKSQQKYENSRKIVADFINASEDEIIFTKNTTESINLAADILSKKLNIGDEILLTIEEHHANILPWQKIAQRTGARLIYANLNKDLLLDIDDLKTKTTSRTKIISVTHASNVLGYINPIKEIAKIAKSCGAYLVVDGAQYMPHFDLDIKDLGCDMYAFSGHKMLSPFGVGILYAKKEILEKADPFIVGGGIVKNVGLYKTEYITSQKKFEAGTQNISAVVGLAKAIEYLKTIRCEKSHKELSELYLYMLKELSKIKEIELYGEKYPEKKTPIISFNIKGIHSHDVSSILDETGIAIRSGNHCAQPLVDYLKIGSCARASLYFYNTKDDIDELIKAIHRAIKIFS